MLDIDARTHEPAWTEDDFRDHLRKRNMIGMVAERGDRVLGYMVYELRKNQIDVVRFGVDPEFTRKGVGSQMIEKLKGKLHENRRTVIATEMRERNLDGLLFLREQGFMATGLCRGWYDDSGEDMIQMEYMI